MGLIDPFGREITYLRISVTDRCNLRCSYCMPEHAYHVDREEVLTFEEIDRLVGIAVSLGWRKVRLTGGEPLVRKDFLRLVERLAGHKTPCEDGRFLRELVMTTNAVLLSRHAHALRGAGLDRINVSLDTLDPARFRRITGFDKLPDVLEGIAAAEEAGFRPLKINTVLIKGSTDDELPRFVEMARTRRVDVRFIEFMPFGGNGWSPDRVLASSEVRSRIQAEAELVPALPGPDGGPARTFTAAGWRGSVSFISPMTDRSFCTRCNRVRMTSEGRLRGCLLNENETDFRSALREGVDDDGLAAMFRRAIAGKPELHPFHRDLEAGTAEGPAAGRGMHRIGG